MLLLVGSLTARETLKVPFDANITLAMFSFNYVSVRGGNPQKSEEFVLFLLLASSFEVSADANVCIL